MSRIKGNAPVISAHCDACRSTDTPTEIKRVDGIELRICVTQALCIGRAKAFGTWLSTVLVVPGRSES